MTRHHHVSIPVWYDWKDNLFAAKADDFNVSIPVWYDWKAVEHLIALPLRSFQFQYGTIGSIEIKTIQLLRVFVSIPVWYDWKIDKALGARRDWL